MAFKDFDSKDLVVGCAALVLLFVGMVYGSLMLYKLIGYAMTTSAAVASVVWMVYQEYRMNKYPQEKRQYLINLHKAVWASKYGYRIRMFMYMLNVAAQLALLMLGWWGAFVIGLAISVYIVRHIHNAETIHCREGTAA